ncbi:MAG TPA: hypothetical protein VGZ93_09650 [Candidatus Methylacidiphilales bacterium]|nr:hypothetical protein [Candidatus Methylacidiphilales bacterium]
MKRIFLIAAVAFIFGLASAYISIQIFNYMGVDSDNPKHPWCEFFIITLSPAGIIHKTIYGDGDLTGGYEGEIQGEPVIEDILANGLGWMLIVLSFTFLILGLRMWWHKSPGS